MTAQRRYVDEGSGKNGWDYEGTTGDDIEVQGNLNGWFYWRGDDGNDFLRSGGAGNEDSGGFRYDIGRSILHGENGNDTLIAGFYDDTLVGGAGADKFVLDADNSGVDLVRDFSVSEGDKVQIDTDDGNETTPAALNITIAGNENRAVISVSGEQEMILAGVDAADVTDDNFASYFEVI